MVTTAATTYNGGVTRCPSCHVKSGSAHRDGCTEGVQQCGQHVYSGYADGTNCYLCGAPRTRAIHVKAFKPDTNTKKSATKKATKKSASAPRLKCTRVLTPRECATVLHGLRVLQAEGRIEGCAAGDAGGCDHFEDYAQLSNAEIDELCEAFNFGDFDSGNGDSSSGVGSISAVNKLIARAERAMDDDR